MSFHIFKALHVGIIVFIFIPSIVFSQQYNISGTILTEDKRVADLIYIKLFQADTILVDQTISDSSGYFSFLVNEGSYVLVYKYLNIEVYKHTINIDNDIDLGEIIVNISKELEAITVSASKPLIERKIDRLVFNVGQSIRSTGGNAWDALNATPLVLINQEKISIAGKSGVTIMINEQTLPFPLESLIGILQSIRADEINRIEVITTPPAKYDAEGNGGIINIVLKTNLQEGFFGNINVSLKKATKNIIYPSLALNYKKNKIVLNININLNYGNSNAHQEFQFMYPNRLWEEDLEQEWLSKDYNGRFTAEYQLRPRVKIGANYGIRQDIDAESSSVGEVKIYNYAGSLDSSINYHSKNVNNTMRHSISTYTTIRFDDNYMRGKNMYAHVEYFGRSINPLSNFSNRSYLPNGTEKTASFFNANTINEQDVDIMTAKIDFNLPNNFFELETGLKSTFIETNTDFVFYDKSSGTSILDTSKTNIFRYSEQIYAAYGTIDMWLSQQIEIKLGLRAESTHTIGNSITTGIRNKNNVLKVFPTTYLTYMFDDYTYIGLSYSQRVDRPNYSWLNPFKYYNTSYNYYEGNPNLRQYYTNSLELSFSHKQSYTQVFINVTKNNIDQIDFMDSTSNIIRLSPINMTDMRIIGFYQMVNFSWFNNKLNNSSYVVGYHSKTSSHQPATIPNIKGWGAQFNSTFTYTFGNRDRISAEITLRYFSPAVAASYKASEWYDVNLSLKTMLLENKNFIIAITGNDIFKTGTAKYQQYVNGIKQTKYSYYDSRYVRLSLTYNFGAKFLVDKKDDAIFEEKNRI